MTEKAYTNRRANSGFSLEERKRVKGRSQWRVRIQVRDKSGATVWQTVGTYPTKTEASLEGAQAVARRDAGTLLRKESATIAQLLDDWLVNELPSTVAEENRQTYEIIVNKHLKPHIGDVLVQDLDVQQVEQLYAYLRDQKYSGSLIRKVHQRLSSSLDRAVRFGLLNTNPCKVAKVPTIKSAVHGVWTLDEVTAFLEAADAEDAFMREKRVHLTRLHPYWHLAVETGARTSELLGLKWSDLDLKSNRVTIGDTAVRLMRGTPFLKEGAKSDSGHRTIPLTDDLVQMLKERRKEQLAARVAASEWIDNNLVFATETGRPLNPSHIRRAFDRLVKKSGVSEVGPHGMRRTHVTSLIAAGESPKAVAARVGHADISTTLQTYTRVTRGMEDRLQSTVEALMQASRTKRPTGTA